MVRDQGVITRVRQDQEAIRVTILAVVRAASAVLAAMQVLAARAVSAAIAGEDIAEAIAAATGAIDSRNTSTSASS